MLVKVLNGVFDPPPESLAVPWTYLAILLVVSLSATTLAAVLAIRSSRTQHLELLRAL